MNPTEWAYALRKYTSFVIQRKVTELNPNDINYFKGQTMTNPNTGNKTSLHDAVVENVDGLIYSIEKEGMNLQKDTTFDKTSHIRLLKINEYQNMRIFYQNASLKVEWRYLKSISSVQCKILIFLGIILK
jgi:hypothetical protein